MSNLHQRKNKIMDVDQALSLIKNGDTVTTGGFCGAGVAEDLLISLEERYLESSSPGNLTLVYCAGQGDFKSTGLSRLGHPGMVSKIIAGHYGGSPILSRFVIENEIQGYNLPQGVLSQMFRDIAAKKPRTLTHVGLGTFVDPRLDGGKMNPKTEDDIVELVEFDGKEYLAYKTFPIDVAILRGTTADEFGNISLEKEALTLETRAQAMAVKNHGGKVIVQVERIVQKGTLNPKHVTIPGIMVDAVVMGRPENHWQTYAEQYNPSYSGETKVPMQMIPKLALTVRKIIARRAAMELSAGDVVNLGIGMPEGIASVANEEGLLDDLTLTAEPGVIGGMPAAGLSFGASVNPHAIIDQPSQFDFYHGGGLDAAFLGLAQVGRTGNLNVSRFGPKLSGSGGFIDISQNAKKVVFLGTFTAEGLDVSIDQGNLKIVTEGKNKKFIQEVEQITFSAAQAVNTGRPVLYVTERCVFKLTGEGLQLVEVAPGINVQKDIIDQMAFKPIIPDNVKLMDSRIFKSGIMGIRKTSSHDEKQIEIKRTA